MREERRQLAGLAGSDAPETVSSAAAYHKPAAAELDRQIRLAQVRLCYASTVQAQVVTAVNGLLLGAFLHPVVDSGTLYAWLCAMLGIGLLRCLTYARFRRCPDPVAQLRHWERWSFTGAVLAGAMWGSAGALFFVPDSLPHQVFLAFVLGGMTAGAVTTLSVQRHAANVFIVLTLSPLACRYLLTAHEFAYGMGFMVSLFMAMMLIAARRFFHNYQATLAESLQREAAERELAQLAYYDPLTELPNRRLFSDYLQRASASARRHGTRVAVCYLDLDNFKGLNDRHGHALGDRVLVRAARILQASVRADDVIARWGGDEFALLLTHVADADACALALARLRTALAEPLFVDGVSCSLSASIGVALGPHDNDDADTLLRQADHAMYLAKRAGRGRHHIFDRARDGDDRRRSEARRALALALAREELVLYVQPKVDLAHDVVHGAEVLVRWQHPERGLLAPGAFLPQWEEDASMADLDRWVLSRALAQLDGWLGRGVRLVLSINVSAWLLHDPGFDRYLAELLMRYPRTRGMVELEVTETRALDDIDRISAVMHACAGMGVEFALDDFGTGFSSLVHLQRLPARTLKIDASFVLAMLESENDRNLVRGIVGLGQALGKEIVAEGVETPAHAEALRQLGCRHVQGYGIARPMPAPELPGWIRQYGRGTHCQDEAALMPPAPTLRRLAAT